MDLKEAGLKYSRDLFDRLCSITNTIDRVDVDTTHRFISHGFTYYCIKLGSKTSMFYIKTDSSIETYLDLYDKMLIKICNYLSNNG